MYAVDSDRFTSKPNPKKEFTLYFKESGAAAALQDAMILLYKMPIKPTNLAEFFSQYFENGAQQLTRISLLKAELCYKRDELQNKTLKVKESENHIKQLIDELGISEEEFILKFFPEQIKEENLSLIEYNIKDMDSRVSQEILGEDDIIPRANNSFIVPKIEVPAEPFPQEDNNYDLENDCLKNISSDIALKEYIKELDPWGIIWPKSKLANDGQRTAAFAQDIHPGGGETGASHASHGDKEHELEDDDANSLAEVFQQSSRDWIINQSHDENSKLHNRLLMIKKADRVRMSEFLGWSPLHSKEDLTDFLAIGFEKESFVSSTNIRSSKENSHQRPCWERGADQLSPPPPVATDLNPQEPDNDAFLLEEDHLEHVNKLRKTTQESFDYEFQRWSREPRSNVDTEETCQPVCQVANISGICSAVKTTQSDGMLYAEDSLMNESLGFIPGKMANWTSQYLDYPLCSTTGEYFEFGGENEYFPNCGDSAQVVENSAKKALTEVPMNRIDSSCHCMLTGMYNVDDMLDKKNTGGLMEEQAATTSGSERKSKTRLGRLSLSQKDEATLTDDSALENELFEVFKQKQNRKASVRKDKLVDRSELELDEPSRTIDVFGMDLTTEVKRIFLAYQADKGQQPPYKLIHQQRK